MLLRDLFVYTLLTLKWKSSARKCQSEGTWVQKVGDKNKLAKSIYYSKQKKIYLVQ